jgi:hypothetical protein
MISNAEQFDSAMELKEQERQPPIRTAMLSSSFQIYFPYFFSLFFTRREGGGRTEGYCVGRCRLCRSYHTSFIAPWCNNRGGEAAGLRKHSKNDFMHHRLLMRRTLYITGYCNCI